MYQEDDDNPPPLSGKKLSNCPSSTSRNYGRVGKNTGKNMALPPSGFCDSPNSFKSKITIGEPGADQLKSVGRHLLQIGRQLLEEMNFVEGLLGNFGSLGLVTCKDELDNDTELIPYGSQDSCCVVHPTANKQQLENSIAAQSRRLNWFQQTTEDVKQAVKSTYESPVHSKTLTQTLPPTHSISNGTKNQDEMNKRLAAMECKVEQMSEDILCCEKKICEVYGKLQEGIDNLACETSCLRDQIQDDLLESHDAKTVISDRIKTFEGQVLKLAQIVWELKCETRAQMHFGKDS